MALDTIYNQHLLPEDDSSFDLGSAAKAWRYGYFDNVNIGGIADPFYWTRTGTTLNPKTANDNVDIGSGTFTGVNVTSGADPGHTHSAYLNLDQTTPQTFTNFAGGTGLMKVTAGLLGIDTSAYITGVAWSEITGTQTDINLSGFTNDSGFIATSDVWNSRYGETIPANWDDPVFVKEIRVGDVSSKEFNLLGRINFDTIEEPATITAVLAGAAGNIDNGTHRYKVTYHNVYGETQLSAAYDEVVVTDKTSDGQVTVTIPVSTEEDDVTARTIYRGKAGVSTANYYRMVTINDNTTTEYLDNNADADLEAGDYRNKDDTTSALFYKEDLKFGFFGTNNFSLGFWAMGSGHDVAGWWNFALGAYVMKSITTGGNNVGIGTYALENLENASGTVALGAQSLQNIVSGYDNCAIGFKSMLTCVSGRQNVGVGGYALYTQGSSYSVALGYQAGYKVSATGVVAIGRQALYDGTSATGMTVIGYMAGYSPAGVTANKCTTSTYGTFIGYQSGLASATQRVGAIAIGYKAVVDAAYTLALGGTGAQAIEVVIGATTARDTFDVVGTMIANGYKSSDGSAGVTTTFTNGDAATVTVKNGLITSIV